MGTWEEVDESVPASRGKKILPSKMVLKVKLFAPEDNGGGLLGGGCMCGEHKSEPSP